jgi:two-component system, sensor histidine kinase PdtaS
VKPIRVRTPVAAVGLALALFLFISALAALFVWQGHRDALSRGEQRAAIAAQTIAAHFQWIIEASRQSLRRINDTLDFRPELWNSRELGDLDDIVAALPGRVQVRVFDAGGNEVLSSEPDAGGLNVSDSPYFQMLRDGERFVVSRLLIDRLTGARSFVVARRLERERGFAGIAAIVIPSSLISEFWSSLGLGPGSSASVIRDDGWIVARHPPLDESVDLSEHVLFTHFLPQSPSGSYQSDASPADGIARLVGYHRVPDTPLVAVAAVSAETALADFRLRIRRLAIGALPAYLGLIGLSFWLSRLLAIDERRRKELEEALEQNRLLLREVHHRVKNNLQTVSSLVRLQPMAPEARRDLSDRITAMAAVHEQIYRSNRFGDINLDTYLRNIAESVRASYDSAVDLDFSTEPVAVDPDKAMVLGLVVTELVSNSIKHGFPDRSEGRISIELVRLDDRTARLTLRDSGVGFDVSQATTGLGIRLIKGFAEQLNGKYELKGDGGLSYELVFPTG